MLNISCKKLNLRQAATFQAKINLAWLVAATFQAKIILSWLVAATFQDKLRKWQIGLGKTIFLGGAPCFLHLSIDLGPPHAYSIPLLQKESIWLSFSGHRTSICKVPPRIGGHHFLLCQPTKKKRHSRVICYLTRVDAGDAHASKYRINQGSQCTFPLRMIHGWSQTMKLLDQHSLSWKWKGSQSFYDQWRKRPGENKDYKEKGRITQCTAVVWDIFSENMAR